MNKSIKKPAYKAHVAAFRVRRPMIKTAERVIEQIKWRCEDRKTKHYTRSYTLSSKKELVIIGAKRKAELNGLIYEIGALAEYDSNTIDTCSWIMENRTNGHELKMLKIKKRHLSLSKIEKAAEDLGKTSEFGEIKIEEEGKELKIKFINSNAKQTFLEAVKQTARLHDDVPETCKELYKNLIKQI